MALSDKEIWKMIRKSDLNHSMKLTIITLSLYVLQVSANISIIGQSLNLNVKDQTVKGVFKII